MQDISEEAPPGAAEDDAAMNMVNSRSPNRSMPATSIRVTHSTRNLPAARHDQLELKKPQDNTRGEEDDMDGGRNEGDGYRDGYRYRRRDNGSERDDEDRDDEDRGDDDDEDRERRIQTQARHLAKAAASTKKQTQVSVVSAEQRPSLSNMKLPQRASNGKGKENQDARTVKQHTQPSGPKMPGATAFRKAGDSVSKVWITRIIVSIE